MNEHLRDRVLRKLDTLSDERGYQVLDYIEFLESKYAERQAASAGSIFARFSEAVEDRLRAGKISASTIAETMSLMNRAMNALNGVATGVAAAGRSVASDLAAASRTSGQTAGQAGSAGASTPAAAAPGSATGAAVAGSSAAGTSSAPPAAEPVTPGPSGDPRATESGELDPPTGGGAGEAAKP
jgi:hypothetical protein